MNDLDSARLAGQMVERGWSPTRDVGEADLVLLNTCSVREKAEEKVYSVLGRLAVLRREKPGLLVGVTGCVAQQVGEELLTRDRTVDFVVGTGNVDRLGEIIGRVETDRVRQAALSFDYENPAYRFDTIVRESPFHAMVTVVEGCDKFCTFCVVPFTRGRERSRRRNEIVAEIRALVEEKGIVEILLLGQTVNAYRDPETSEGFGRLLEVLSTQPGLKRIRFVTSHPSDVDSSMIQAMAGSENVCRYLHLPPQSGSDRVLSRMKRQYDRASYLRTVEKLRAEIPVLSLSGDVIVGFPGETEEDFLETMSLVEEVRFSSLFTFKYSPRPGTAAHRWGCDVTENVMDERLARLSLLQDRISKELNQDLVGRELLVLVEGNAKRAGQVTGRSDCNRIVNFRPKRAGSEAGRFARVRVERAFEHSLAGVEIESSN